MDVRGAARDEAHVGWLDRAQLAGLASLGAGAIHLAAAGIHAEHPTLARLFVLLGAAQVVAGLLLALQREPGSPRPASSASAPPPSAVGAHPHDRHLLDRRARRTPRRRSSPTPSAPRSVRSRSRSAPSSSPSGGRPRHGAASWPPARSSARVSVAAMLTGATHVHSHEARLDRVGRRRAHATATSDRRRRPRRTATTAVATDHAHGDEAADGHAHTATRHEQLAAAVGPGGTDRLLRRRRRHRRAAGPGRGARRQHAGRPAPVRRRHDDRRPGLPVDRRRRRPASSTTSTAATSATTSFLDPNRPESLVYQVDGEQRTLVSAMYIAKDRAIDDPELVDFGGAADAVARPRQPVLEARRRRQARRRRRHRRRRQLRAAARSTPAAATRWSTCGSRPTSAARSPPSRATAPARRRATAPRADQCAHDHGATAGTDDATHGGVRPDTADRPVGRRGRDRRAAGATPRTSSRARWPTCRSGPTRPSPRPPASTRSATPAPATSTTSSGTGSTTTSRSTRTTPRASSTSPSPTARSSWCRRCTCCRRRSPSRTCPTTAGR